MRSRFFSEKYVWRESDDSDLDSDTFSSDNSQSDAENSSASDDIMKRKRQPDYGPHLWETLKGPYSSIYKVRYALLRQSYREVFEFTRDLSNLKDITFKEPVKFIIARYLACLKQRVLELPDRKERRQLPADKARYIVSLKSRKFAILLGELFRRWGQPVPKALCANDETNEMLIELEDVWLTPLIPGAHNRKAVHWESNGHSPLPLPILGLEFTLSFYFPTTPIDLSDVLNLSLDSRKLSALPNWIREMRNLQILYIRWCGVKYLPSWIITMKRLRSIVDLDCSTAPFRPRIPRFTELISCRIRQFVENGGDWTDFQDFPTHLLNGILTSGEACKRTQLLQLKHSDGFYLVERVRREDLKGTNWRSALQVSRNNGFSGSRPTVGPHRNSTQLRTYEPRRPPWR